MRTAAPPGLSIRNEAGGRINAIFLVINLTNLTGRRKLIRGRDPPSLVSLPNIASVITCGFSRSTDVTASRHGLPDRCDVTWIPTPAGTFTGLLQLLEFLLNSHFHDDICVLIVRKQVAPAMETPLESSDGDHANQGGKKSLGGALTALVPKPETPFLSTAPFFSYFARTLPSLVPLSPASSLPADHWLPA